MSALKPTLDSKRTITLYPEEGLDIPIAEQDPVTGDQVDLSTLTLKFHLSSGWSKDLEVDPEDPLGRRILLTHAELKTNLPSAGGRWALVDETGVGVTLAYGAIVWEDPSWID